MKKPQGDQNLSTSNTSSRILFPTCLALPVGPICSSLHACPYSQLPEYPFLQGRAFVFASQYAKLLPAQVAGQYLNAAVQVLESAESSATVKLSAVKAIKKHVLRCAQASTIF